MGRRNTRPTSCWRRRISETLVVIPYAYASYVQAAACMGVLGPRTVFVLAIKGFPGTHEFLLQDDGKFIHVKETTEIGEQRGVVKHWW